ncbi:MAG: 2-C-methyl-D-erythritol 4-phosphate cytidylyltransferase [Bacilli bacterium]|nr:2-C-methyl-D-erythritol 4-phosphate cytidylyltransferase [Bacilli bacterium]
MRINVIILGAGNSTRMHTDENKVFMKIHNKFILEYSIDTFLKIDDITSVIVVYNKKDIEKVNSIRDKYNNLIFVEGGYDRQGSLRNGINKIDKNVDKIIVHDAARPLIYLDVLKNIIAKSKNKKVLIPVRKAIEGVKIINNDIISKSVSRDNVVFCQTPQVFDKDVIYKLKENTNKGVITFLLDLNIKMDVYYLEKDLLKITTIEDLYYYDYLIGRKFDEED